MPRIPIKPHSLRKRQLTLRQIVLHHSACKYVRPSAFIDTIKYQFDDIMDEVLVKAQIDIDYHYIVERIKNDYVVMVGRPTTTYCDFRDLTEDQNRSIHIAILGDYNFKKPDARLYTILAYRLVGPLLSTFGWTGQIERRVKLHKEFNPKIDCPGELFDKSLLIAAIRRTLIKP